MNQAPQPTRRTRPGDLGGHGAFTYMVMYSVRAQSSRYIGLSQSSDTMPPRTTKSSFSPSPSSYLTPIYSSYPILFPSLSLSYYDIVIHYSILRHHEFPRDDILIVRRTANTRQYTVGLRRKRRGVDDSTRRDATLADGGDAGNHPRRQRERDGARARARQTKGRKYNSMYNV